MNSKGCDIAGVRVKVVLARKSRPEGKKMCIIPFADLLHILDKSGETRRNWKET
jgi:hypothetical protein